MRTKYSEQPWVRKDLENSILRDRLKALGGYSPTQALIKLFQDQNIRHFIRQDAEGHITGLIFTFPWCEEMWRHHSQILSMDCTYKTNRFNMPFFNITSITSVHSTFNVAFVLLDQEDEESYQWAVEQLEELRKAVQADLLNVVITDFEQGLKNALNAVWADTQQL